MSHVSPQPHQSLIDRVDKAQVGRGGMEALRFCVQGVWMGFSWTMGEGFIQVAGKPHVGDGGWVRALGFQTRQHGVQGVQIWPGSTSREV